MELRSETILLWKKTGIKRCAALENQMEIKNWKWPIIRRLKNMLKTSRQKVVNIGRYCTSDSVWCFPHFRLVNTDKPGKIKFICDGFGTSNGMPLNEGRYRT